MLYHCPLDMQLGLNNGHFGFSNGKEITSKKEFQIFNHSFISLLKWKLSKREAVKMHNSISSLPPSVSYYLLKYDTK
jgi:hypothetical protein